MRLEGKSALITGAADGFGLAIARRFVAEGARVAVVDVNYEGAVSKARELGGSAISIACDVSKSNEVADAVRQTGRRATAVAADVTDGEQLDALVAAAGELGGLNIWVSNAGGLPDATPRYLTRTPEDR